MIERAAIPNTDSTVNIRASSCGNDQSWILNGAKDRMITMIVMLNVNRSHSSDAPQYVKALTPVIDSRSFDLVFRSYEIKKVVFHTS